MHRKENQLELEFFARKTEQVARNLLGKKLCSKVDGHQTGGIIVETEAYLPQGDSACHATKSRTSRTEIMFARAGHAYVYPIHAKHCFNVVTDQEEKGCAVLIRALEPVEGLETMKRRRNTEDVRRLTTGPACLCQALGIDRSINGVDLLKSELVWLESSSCWNDLEIKTTVRIGVTSAEELPLRFVVKDNSFVSGPKRLR